jgi:hypothetical protein
MTTKELRRSNVKHKVGECVKLSLGAGKAVLIDEISSVVHVMLKENLGHLLGDDLIRFDSARVSISYCPDTSGILVSLEPTPLRLFS